MYLEMKNCEYCGEEIKSNLRRCPFCGSLLKLEKHQEAKTLTTDTSMPDIDEVQTEVETKAETEVETKAGTEVEAEAETEVKAETIEDTNFIVMEEPYNYEKDPYYKDYGKDAFNKNKKCESKPLNNGYKVFLTVISTAIPGFGQLIGIISAIIFMNSDIDSDRRSFGIALLIASSTMFVISFLCFFVIILAIGSLKQ